MGGEFLVDCLWVVVDVLVVEVFEEYGVFGFIGLCYVVFFQCCVFFGCFVYWIDGCGDLYFVFVYCDVDVGQDCGWYMEVGEVGICDLQFVLFGWQWEQGFVLV